MNELPDNISNPAKRALASASIVTLQDLTRHTEKEISKLHGLGPSTIKVLKRVLAEQGLSFK